MPYSTVRLCNRALAKVGNYAIMSLDDPSDHAVLLRSVYGLALDAELSANRWGFATARKTLPALDEAPAFGFRYVYLLPADCLRVLDVGREWPSPDTAAYRSGPNARWQIEGGAVLTNSPPPLPVVYLRRVEDPARFPAAFTEALACKIAVEICERLAGGQSRRELLWKEYDHALRTARRVNAIQRAPETARDGAWMLSRRISADGGDW